MLYGLKKYLLWFILCFFVLTGTAQKANYRQAERFAEQNLKALFGSTKVEPKFLKDSDKFWYRYQMGDGARYYFVDPKARMHRELFDRAYLAGEISKVTGKAIDSKNMMLHFSFKEDEKTIAFRSDTCFFEYNIYTKQLVKVDTVLGEQGLKVKSKGTKKIVLAGTYSPDSSYVVYARDYNLYLFSIADSVESQLTTDGAENYSYAKYDGKGKKTEAYITWFADSKSFIAERTDSRMKSKRKPMYLVNHVGKGRPTVREYDYVIAGEEFVEQEEMYFFRVDDKKQVKVALEKWQDQKVQVYTVGLDGKEPKRGMMMGKGKPAREAAIAFYFLRKRRTCDEVDFCRVDSRTGEVKVLINEVSKPFFNDDFFNVSLLNGGKDIIWWSERTGRGHLYHYDGEGNLKNAITSGDWTTGRVLKTDEKERVIYFAAYGQVPDGSPYYARVNKAWIDKEGKVQMLTPEEATHGVVFSKSGRYFVDNYSRADLEPRSVLRDNKGKVVCELASPDLTRLYQAGWRMPESFTIKAADGTTDLYGYMWKPIDFDSTKRYPIISYVYPGPQADGVPYEFNPSGYFNTALAQLGFVVVTFGHRGGTPFRDRWYHTYCHGNLRDYALADDKCGIEQLAERYPFIDITRVGIFGHSGGGFMSTAAICTYPDFYKAAVSSSGNHDNTIYNQWWGETHHGLKEITAQETKKVKSDKTGKDTTITMEKTKFEYKVPTNMELAKNLKGHLMLVHGEADNNVHPAHTMRMVDALLKAGKNFDLVILPGQPHVYSGQSKDFYERKMWAHFAKHLLGDFSCEGFVEIDDFKRQ